MRRSRDPTGLQIREEAVRKTVQNVGERCRIY